MKCRADAGVEIELLPHRHDWAEVGVSLASQFRTQFRLGFFLRLRSDSADKPEFELREQVDRPLRQRVALAAPAIPADVGMNVFGIKSDCLQNPQSLGQNLISDSVARHRDYRTFGHYSLPI